MFAAQAKCSSKAKKLEDEIAEKQAELEGVQQDRAAREAAHDALVKDIAETERRLQVNILFLSLVDIPPRGLCESHAGA